jgi:hypothetical protein
VDGEQGVVRRLALPFVPQRHGGIDACHRRRRHGARDEACRAEHRRGECVAGDSVRDASTPRLTSRCRPRGGSCRRPSAWARAWTPGAGRPRGGRRVRTDPELTRALCATVYASSCRDRRPRWRHRSRQRSPSPARRLARWGRVRPRIARSHNPPDPGDRLSRFPGCRERGFARADQPERFGRAAADLRIRILIGLPGRGGPDVTGRTSCGRCIHR